MKKMTTIVTSTLLLTLSQFGYADWGDRKNDQLDRKGDRIENRLDKKAFRAAANGNYQRAAKLNRKGNRVDNHLDRKGDNIERRFDNR